MSEIIYPKSLVFPDHRKWLRLTADGIKYRLKMRRGDSYWLLGFRVRHFKVVIQIYPGLLIKSVQVNGYIWQHVYRHGLRLQNAEGLPECGLPDEVVAIVNNALQAIVPALRQARQAEALEYQINKDKAERDRQRKLAQKQRHFSRVLQQLR